MAATGAATVLERLRSRLLEWLRVPPEPTLPPGADEVRVFRAAPAYFRYKLALWALAQLATLLGLGVGLVVTVIFVGGAGNELLTFLVQGAALIAIAVFFAQGALSLAVLRLDFEMRWYILADRSLRIREGVLRMHEKTMTYANIQQITIRRNPLQQILGIADVRVRTAGGGAGGGKGNASELGESLHEAYFRGVDNAGEIRAAIRERVRLYRDSGLGDPDDAPPRVAERAGGAAAVPVEAAAAPAHEGGVLDEALAAARALRDEVRALRQTWSS